MDLQWSTDLLFTPRREGEDEGAKRQNRSQLAHVSGFPAITSQSPKHEPISCQALVLIGRRKGSREPDAGLSVPKWSDYCLASLQQNGPAWIVAPVLRSRPHSFIDVPRPKAKQCGRDGQRVSNHLVVMIWDNTREATSETLLGPAEKWISNGGIQVWTSPSPKRLSLPNKGSSYILRHIHRLA